MPENSPRLIGVVDSDKRAKSRRVIVDSVTRHPRYGKFIKHRSVLHVHDETNASRMGDRVEIAECRPISRTKSWTLVRVVEKAPEALA
ncbi:MAG: 30S ribosomal protein S17 [Planctomycetota bacterium]|nr:30S ribosomal protein S17 [Planctomycetota bacterium]